MPYPDDSSHLLHWIFSEEALEEQRLRVFKEGEANIRKKLETVNSSGSNAVQLPSKDATEHLISYFVTQLIYVCSEKRFDYRISNTAAAFFIRFYLKRSPLEYDPRRVLLTCVLLAAKVEECSTSYSLSHFCDGLIPSRDRLKEIVNGELMLLDALSFQIRILHARPPIHYLTTEYYQRHKPPKNDPQFSTFGQKVTELNTEAEQLALQALSDNKIPFLYSPAQIGTACFLHLCAQDPVFSNAESFIESLISQKKGLIGIDFTDIRPVLLGVRTRLALLVEQRKCESAETRAQKALKTIKQIEKITKLLNKVAVRSRKSDRMPSNVKHDNDTARVQSSAQPPTAAKQDPSVETLATKTVIANASVDFIESNGEASLANTAIQIDIMSEATQVPVIMEEELQSEPPLRKKLRESVPKTVQEV